jgi:hypothetical protein
MDNVSRKWKFDQKNVQKYRIVYRPYIDTAWWKLRLFWRIKKKIRHTRFVGQISSQKAAVCDKNKFCNPGGGRGLERVREGGKAKEEGELSPSFCCFSVGGDIRVRCAQTRVGRRPNQQLAPLRHNGDLGQWPGLGSSSDNAPVVTGLS